MRESFVVYFRFVRATVCRSLAWSRSRFVSFLLFRCAALSSRAFCSIKAAPLNLSSVGRAEHLFPLVTFEFARFGVESFLFRRSLLSSLALFGVSYLSSRFSC